MVARSALDDAAARSASSGAREHSLSHPAVVQTSSSTSYSSQSYLWTDPGIRIEARGKSIPQLRVLLARLCDNVDRILADYKGLTHLGWQLACPHCLAAGRWDNLEEWKLGDVVESVDCRQCRTRVALSNQRELLVFVCSPSCSPLPHALPEANEVRDTCSGVVEIRHGGTADELRRQLQAAPTRRFLFSGHADASDPSGSGHTLGFTKPGGGLELVRASDIASVLGHHAATAGGFGAAAKPLELCFLNGCESLELGRAAIVPGVPTVVCWRTKAFDPAARTFAKAFSEALATGRTYREAFVTAVHALKVKTHPDPTDPFAAAVPMFQLCGPDESVGPLSKRYSGGMVVRYSFLCGEPHPCRYGCGRCPLPIPCGEPVLIDSSGELRGSVDCRVAKRTGSEHGSEVGARLLRFASVMLLHVCACTVVVEVGLWEIMTENSEVRLSMQILHAIERFLSLLAFSGLFDGALRCHSGAHATCKRSASCRGCGSHRAGRA